MKEVNLKGYILHDYNCMTFWERAKQWGQLPLEWQYDATFTIEVASSGNKGVNNEQDEALKLF